MVDQNIVFADSLSPFAFVYAFGPFSLLDNADFLKNWHEPLMLATSP